MRKYESVKELVERKIAQYEGEYVGEGTLATFSTPTLINNLKIKKKSEEGGNSHPKDRQFFSRVPTLISKIK